MRNSTDFSILLAKGIEIAPRIIGHQDRNILSPTFGGFERRHWAWKTTAMADASNQYALYYLALLWSLNEISNPFYQDPNLINWIGAAISRWTDLQNGDGSFDQVFPNEHSVGATSYSLLAVLETNCICGRHLDQDINSRMLAAIARAGNFLLANDETYALISNHLALFAVTFHELWMFTGKSEYRDKCEQQINLILENMSSEGWFKEYGGADPGYLTQCLYYLGRLLSTGYEELRTPIERAIRDFFPYFIHPDGSIGGHYGSRNTTIFYPGGITTLSSEYPEARRMLTCLCAGMQRGNTPVPGSLDFPNALRLACNYLVSWEILKNNESEEGKGYNYILPCEENSVWKEFPEAGLLAVGTSSYYAILGVSKGGVLKVYDKQSKSLILDDRGYFAKSGKKIVTTQSFIHRKFEQSDRIIKISLPLFIVQLQDMRPWKYFIILLLGMTVFKLKAVRELFKRMLVKYLITQNISVDGKFEREVTFNDHNIKIKDIIVPPKGQKLTNLTRGPNFSTVHMASANYFELSWAEAPKAFVPYVDQEGIELQYEVNFPHNSEF